MLSGLLDSIKQQIGSKSYWLGSMMPLVLFLALNLFVLSLHSPSVAAWLPKTGGLDEKALFYSALVITILAMAYVLSIVSSLLLEALEGKRGPFLWLSGLLCAGQWHALDRIDRKYRAALDRQDEVDDKAGEWKKMLGAGTMAPEAWPFDWCFSAAGRKMAAIRFLHRHGYCIRPERLQNAVELIKKDLLRYERGKGHPLSRARGDLKAAIAYAGDRYQFEMRRLDQRRQADFPGVRPTAVDQPEGPTANSILAPTTMGNIGRAIGTYTLSRHQLDLDIFWTRLQNSLQKDAKEYYAVLQDTKVQVDCAVTLFWLSLAFTLFWTPALIWWFFDSTVREFLLVGIGGSACVAGSYLLACQSYRVFADVMRSSVDLFRFQVLEALHLPLPFSSQEEQDLWFKLGGAIGFGNEEEFQYKHKS